MELRYFVERTVYTKGYGFEKSEFNTLFKHDENTVYLSSTFDSILTLWN